MSGVESLKLTEKRIGREELDNHGLGEESSWNFNEQLSNEMGLARGFLDGPG
jgi:hypothetical protein